jgi:SAM-dependent methyltransferase
MYWDEAARSFPDSGAVTPTTRDPNLGVLEEENVIAHLHGTRLVLDVGCGDGTHTLRYAAHVDKIVGLDIAGGLIERANQNAAERAVSNTEFLSGSVLEATQVLGTGRFDRVISQRCLINLLEWDAQRRALSELIGTLAPGGLLLLTEGFQDELEALNGLRRAVGLPAIEVVSYNRNLRRAELDEFVREAELEIVATRDYGFYLVLSRVLHPLIVRPEAPRHDSPINEAARELAEVMPTTDLRRYSYNLFFALRKPVAEERGA